MSDKEKNAEPAKKTSNLKRWLAGGAAAIVLLGGGGAAGYFLRAETAPAAPPASGIDAAQSPAQGQDGKEVQAQLGPMINIDSFIVNILDDQGTRYLKAAITLEADSSGTAEEVNERMPQIKDAILLLVGNKTFRELNDLQGKLQLRADLMTRLNEILQTGSIKQIYFTEFVVQ